MTSIRHLLLVIAAISLSACATTPAPTSNAKQEPTPADKLERDVPMPTLLGDMGLSRRTIYGNAAAGIGYRYEGDGKMSADVYVYPLSEEQMALLLSEGEQAALRDGYAGFQAELALAQRKGAYDHVEVIDESIFTARFVVNDGKNNFEGPFRIARGEYRTYRDDFELASFAFLTEFSGYFVKIRISHVDYPGFDDKAQWFADALLEHLYSADAANGGTMVDEDSGRKIRQLPGESFPEFFNRAMRIMLPDGKTVTDIEIKT